MKLPLLPSDHATKVSYAHNGLVFNLETREFGVHFGDEVTLNYL